MKRIASLLAVSVGLVLLTSCGFSKYRTPGGQSSHVAMTGSDSKLKQSQNPKDASQQNTSSKIEEEIVIPPGAKVVMQTPVYNKELNTIEISTVQVEFPKDKTGSYRKLVEDITSSHLGAAQKDIVGETIAKLNSMKWIPMIGVVILLGGLVGAFHPAARAILGGTTTGLAIAVGGLLLIALPPLIVGNELLIVLGVIGGIFVFIMVKRYGSKSAAAAIKEKQIIDENKNKIDDRLEKLELIKTLSSLVNKNGPIANGPTTNGNS